METPVFLAVMAAAALHAGWNALLKIGLDRFLTVCLIQIAAGAVALCALPFVALPQAAAWPWIALSALLHVGYNVFLSRAYQYGDLGQVYPLSRGSSPLIVALLSLPLLADSLPQGQWLGLLVLVAGIWLMALRGHHPTAGLSAPMLFSALMTAGFIAGYTLSDAIGARNNQDALSYSMWLFAVNGLVMLGVVATSRGPDAFLRLGPHWRGGLAGGALSLAAYSIVIWAMTQAPVALVSALRESSVLFALLIGSLWLKEALPPIRLLACGLILAGVLVMKLA
ncbi:EamA family transporter [Pseudomonas benzenivorans]|uniref:EamA family transporter n=1 Tax=Pseudomonas benzenivorans TaxID=556533 RepID=A0ABZ0PRK1_9PSED|nr:EamA family transporter [Pseudomonas benzenivorans]WPC03792.1 EamA family transporter [Pseudomonas benzenivorans]